MFAFRRNDPPSQSRLSEKSASRPRSFSSRPSTSPANLPFLRRAPLAPLDPQSTNASLTASDDQMPSSSSSTFLGYTPPDNSQPPDAARLNIGRPIITRAAPDEFGPSPPSARRKSIPNSCVFFLPLRALSHIPLPARMARRSPGRSLCYHSASFLGVLLIHRPFLSVRHAAHLSPPTSISPRLRHRLHRLPPTHSTMHRL